MGNIGLQTYIIIKFQLSFEAATTRRGRGRERERERESVACPIVLDLQVDLSIVCDDHVDLFMVLSIQVDRFIGHGF